MKKLLFIAFSLLLAIGVQAQDVQAITNGLTGQDVGRINAIRRQVNDLSAPSYSYLSFADSASVIDLTEDVWSTVTNEVVAIYASEASNELTVAGDSLTIVNSGHYTGWVQVKYAATAADSIAFAIFENTAIATPVTLWVSTGTEAVYANLPFFISSLVTGDDLTLKVVNYASGDDVTLESITWFTTYLDK